MLCFHIIMIFSFNLCFIHIPKLLINDENSYLMESKYFLSRFFFLFLLENIYFSKNVLLRSQNFIVRIFFLM